jgi:hypothetical protein
MDAACQFLCAVVFGRALYLPNPAVVAIAEYVVGVDSVRIVLGMYRAHVQLTVAERGYLYNNFEGKRHPRFPSMECVAHVLLLVPILRFMYRPSVRSSLCQMEKYALENLVRNGYCAKGKCMALSNQRDVYLNACDVMWAFLLAGFQKVYSTPTSFFFAARVRPKHRISYAQLRAFQASNL